MIERQIEVTTPEGEMTTWVFHPEHDGPSPVVLYFMDGAGIRQAMKEMASRLATAGYYVLLPNLYYRSGPFRELSESDESIHQVPELIRAITPTNVLSDANALLSVAESDPAAKGGAFGVVGFCMSGGLALSVARAMPDRAKAAASIHGAWLVRDSADSPHLDQDRTQAEIYLGWVDNDPTAPPDTIPVMRDALDRAGVRYEFDLITHTAHGYAPPGSERYDRRASEDHWERVHSLLHRNLL